MAIADKAIGGVLVLASVVIFTYYTIWTIFTPFLPTNSPIRDLFPAREWAIRIPAALLVVGLGLVGSLVGLVILRSRRTAAKGKGRGKGA